jgi:hypothetical protein
MKIEKQLQNMFSDETTSPDADNFLDKLHSTRKQRARRTQRLTYSISALVVVLLVGALTITQLNNNSFENQYYTDIEMTDEMFDEMMVYLVEESDDIWSTMEFFYEIENEMDN